MTDHRLLSAPASPFGRKVKIAAAVSTMIAITRHITASVICGLKSFVSGCHFQSLPIDRTSTYATRSRGSISTTDVCGKLQP